MASRKRFRGARWVRVPLALLLLPATVAHAGIALTLHGVRGALRANVLAYLSFERYKDSKHLDGAIIERLENRVQSEVDSALEPYGYFQPTVHPTVRRSGPNHWRVVLRIDPGPPVLLQAVDVKVTGAGAADPRFTRITDHVPLQRGQRLDEAAYERLKGELLQTAATYGYLDARLTRHQIQVDPGQRRASVFLTLATGVRYRFGPTQIEQHALTDALVRRYLRYRHGQPFDLTQLLRTQFVLDDTGYFSDLEVVPGKPDKARHLVPVHIRANSSRRNVYSFAAGYATDTGARGIVSWQDRRVNREGDRMSVDLEAAQLTKYSLQSRYIIPIGDPATENLAFIASVEQRQLAAVDARTMTLGVHLTRVTGRWQTVWFLDAMHATGSVSGPICPGGVLNTAATQCELVGVSVAAPSAVASVVGNMLVPGVEITSVPSGYFGEPIFEHGVSIQLRGSHGALGSRADFLQLRVQLERVFNFAPGWHLLLRDEFGATAASHFDNVPPVLRFFAGGEGSVRGFEYNSLSPTQSFYATGAYQVNNTTYSCYSGAAAPQNVPNPRLCPLLPVQAGGKDLISGSVEIDRNLPHNFGVAAFFDYGNVFNSFHIPHLLQYGAGIGFRVRLPVMTLGIDVGEPLSQPGSPRLYINFSPRL